MTKQSEAKTLFSEMMNREGEINLAKAALLLAKEIEYPDLDVYDYLRKIDLIANEVKRRTSGKTEPYSLIEEINGYLFYEEGFRGNEADYYDPRNSFLNEVLDRKTGIPITLSVLYMEIGRRVGFPVFGVGFPGHFIVKYSGAEGEVLIDPFNKGRIIAENDCQETLNQIYGREIKLQSDFLQTVTNRHILTRMLHNLKGIYISSKDYHKALSVTDMILLVSPMSLNELMDRGLLYYHLECFAQALSDLETYLRNAPKNEDTEVIRSYIPVLKELVGRIS
ncbi:MAG TPA: transglutaminase-like domain-containing protein [Thermodesulfobacteriota bacterium]|nr:transglutaminase-like domain-containing protein [Thermodesulfobacteriota bacterium]